MSIMIASYNLFEGAQETRDQLTEFLAEERFDIVCLQEANRWQDNDYKNLREVSKDAGYEHVVFGKSNTPYNLITMSNAPILSHRVHTEGLWHSAVETEIVLGNTALNVVNLHLNPNGEEFREAEINHLLKTIDFEKSTIMTGDFNSLSMVDQYPKDFAEQLHAKGIVKFGRELISFAVTERLRQAHLVDAAQQLGVLEMTVPSAFNNDKDHEIPLRLDYMFVSKGLVQTLKSFKVVKSPQTDAISDHYPIVLEIEA